eukprot:10294629-Prorocentrum_lima.AAC.1
MTSSLVGSEMCIRDRKGSVRGKTGTCVDPQMCVREHMRGGMGQKERIKPVSYTHLTLPTICSV